MNRRRIFESFRQARDAKPDPGDWMSLADAARAVQAVRRDSELDRLSRGLSTSEATLLAFWAHQVAQIGVPIYGSRIMSTKREMIPRDAFLSGRIVDQATRLAVGHDDPMQDFCALEVDRRDMEAWLARSHGDADPNPRT